MSVNAIEKVLWEIGNDPSRIQGLMNDSAAYLAAYNLDEEEKNMILEVDVKSLADHGVSTLLTMMVWPLFKGPDSMPFGYLDKMNEQ